MQVRLRTSKQVHLRTSILAVHGGNPKLSISNL